MDFVQSPIIIKQGFVDRSHCSGGKSLQLVMLQAYILRC